MSSRIIAQLIINGASIFTRAFINAYQQALRSTFYFMLMTDGSIIYQSLN